MNEETEAPKANPEAEAEEQAEAVEPVVEEPKIMCYVSKVMVPLSETVEVEYEKGKTFRVLPKYVKYVESAEGADA